MQYPATMQPTQVRIKQVGPDEEKEDASNTSLPPVSYKMAKNFFVADTYMETPSGGLAPAAYEQSDPTDFLASFNGLSAVSDDIRSLLPPQCREAFDKAAGREQEWKSRWGPESETMSRRDPVIDKAIVPYNML